SPDAGAGGAFGGPDRPPARPRSARAHARPGMTPRGRALLGLGLLTYVVARAFGSKPLYPVAIGLLVAPLVAWLWVRLAQGPMRLHREIGAEERYEGDDVDVKLRLEHAAAVPAASLELVEQVAGLGELRRPGAGGGFPTAGAGAARAARGPARQRRQPDPSTGPFVRDRLAPGIRPPRCGRAGRPRACGIPARRRRERRLACARADRG